MKAGTSTSRKPASARSVSANGVLRARPALKNRPLLSFVQGVKVAALFKLFGNDTRVRLLHHIVRSGEATVTDMAAKLGMKPRAVSNQLVRLSDGPSGGKRPPAASRVSYLARRRRSWPLRLSGPTRPRPRDSPPSGGPE